MMSPVTRSVAIADIINKALTAPDRLNKNANTSRNLSRSWPRWSVEATLTLSCSPCSCAWEWLVGTAVDSSHPPSSTWQRWNRFLRALKQLWMRLHRLRHHLLL